MTRVTLLQQVVADNSAATTHTAAACRTASMDSKCQLLFEIEVQHMRVRQRLQNISKVDFALQQACIGCAHTLFLQAYASQHVAAMVQVQEWYPGKIYTIIAATCRCSISTMVQ
jgi:hypothetical protein